VQPRHNADLFHAAIGGFGMLGCFARRAQDQAAIPASECREAAALAEMMRLRRARHQDYLPLGRRFPERLPGAA
jgi:hypothetical protein